MPSSPPAAAQAIQPPAAGGPSPRTTATTITSTRPALCVAARTASTGRCRLWSPPKKSEKPQARLDARPRTTAAMAAYPGVCVHEPAFTDRGGCRRRGQRLGHGPVRGRRDRRHHAHPVGGDRHRTAAHGPPLPPAAHADRALAGAAGAAARRAGVVLRPATRLLGGGAPDRARAPDLPCRL